MNCLEIKPAIDQSERTKSAMHTYSRVMNMISREAPHKEQMLEGKNVSTMLMKQRRGNHKLTNMGDKRSKIQKIAWEKE